MSLLTVPHSRPATPRPSSQPSAHVHLPFHDTYGHTPAVDGSLQVRQIERESPGLFNGSVEHSGAQAYDEDCVQDNCSEGVSYEGPQGATADVEASLGHQDDKSGTLVTSLPHCRQHTSAGSPNNSSLSLVCSGSLPEVELNTRQQTNVNQGSPGCMSTLASPGPAGWQYRHTPPVDHLTQHCGASFRWPGSPRPSPRFGRGPHPRSPHLQRLTSHPHAHFGYTANFHPATRCD